MPTPTVKRPFSRNHCGGIDFIFFFPHWSPTPSSRKWSTNEQALVVSGLLPVMDELREGAQNEY